ncbi:triacylglycerol lipase II [Fusarium denticulatum]|uniref:Triacylglycerol lipase II n=1 Tax=Fusarium denticulatum TaxID=48507 RepID=A0A8H5UBJ3_9HYPO|nr:triacylglycerol lipase II [Fusarium denticulatum]
MLLRLSHIVLLCTSSFKGIMAAAKPVDSCPSTTAPRVNLGYARYEGIALSNGVNQFLGMRYAAPPTGSRRFRLPDRPLNETHLVLAHKHGADCYGVNPSAPTPDLEFSEDCLFINVYAPKNATLNKDGGLPVMLWIKAPLTTVLDRLQDQMAAINWIHEHISKFGSNPEKVTLFGTSVGGGIVLLHLLAYGGNSTNSSKQWRAGTAQSMYLPSVYTVDEMQFHYDHLLTATSCSDFGCLRQLPIEQFQANNTAIPFPGQFEPALFGYGPTIDGSSLP